MVLAAVHEDVAKAVMDKMQREYEMGEIEYDSYFYKHGVSVGREEGVAKGRAEGREEGRAEGMALALLTMLRARGVDVSDELRAALTECHDLDLLERLAARASQVAHGDELLDGLPRV